MTPEPIAQPAPTPLPPPPPAASAAAAGPCASTPDCLACTARGGCRFCTEPRGCVSQQDSCAGLSLGYPTTCVNDPVSREQMRRAEGDKRRQDILDSVRGMTPAGPTIQARLERLSSVVVPAQAGKCHVLLWTFDADARPSPSQIRLAYKTPRHTMSGLTRFELEARAGTSGTHCSRQPAEFRFTLVDPYTYAPLSSGGSGGLTFTLYARPMTHSDHDDSAGVAIPRGRSVGVDCQDCTFPCEASKRDCERRCFVDEREMSGRRACERTCEQIARACLRGCPGCW